MASDRSEGRVCVIVVSYNGRVHLERCLPALERQTYDDFEVVVVDNGSTDGSVEWLRRNHPRARLIESPENVGFAAANNMGLASSSSLWVALLNNDAEPEPGWLAALMEQTTDRPELASVASLMVWSDAPEMVNSAGIAADITGIAWDRLGGAPVSSARSEVEVFGASAGAALYRRSALEDAADVSSDGRPEVFDERFFLYMEDVDLAWRLRLRGWRSVCAPDAVVRHEGSASAGEGTPFKNRLLARNKVWTVLKNYPSGPLVRNGLLVLAYDKASIPYRLLVHGQTAALRGRIDALGGLPETLRRRRRVQRRRRAEWHELARSLSPLETPWAVMRRYDHLRNRVDGG